MLFQPRTRSTDCEVPAFSQEGATPFAQTLFYNGSLATMTGKEASIGLIEQGSLLLEGEHIAWAGPGSKPPPELLRQDSCRRVDLAGRLLTPGLIDCHSHMVFGGNRAGEFEQRLQGVSYAEIARRGGGILSTVQATRAASEEDLVAAALPRLDRLVAEGVTTVEIKSGYALETEGELKMLRAARRLGQERGIDVRTTFLGAHALPPEYRQDRHAYLRLIREEMLPAVVAAGLADAVDGFCEGIAFSTDEMAEVFEAAKAMGLPIKLHAEQLSDLGGAAMAARLGALSADHLEYLGPDGIEALAEAGSVAVLLPGAFYYLSETRKPPVAGLLAAGVPIAVATDLNPGSSPIYSLLAVMNMSCVLFGLTPSQALRGVTLNAARALGLKDRGQLVAGQLADLAIWQVDSPGELAYPLGLNPCVAALKRGELMFGGTRLGWQEAKE